ncbi:MAG TPA: sigma-70 family RNA polymerase sigma factor [Polyangiaceae bacterium]|nr:sigma-70 family RNA polymerase sigma factor [Polyangiaceae bacterium]
MNLPHPVSIEDRIRELHAERSFDRAAELAIARYGSELQGWLTNSVRDETAAREIYSICLESFWRALPQFRFEATIRTLMYRLARNATYRYFCGRQREELVSSCELWARPALDRSETHPWLKTEIKVKLRAVCERLTIKQRMVLTLRVDKQMSWSEIARVMSQGEAWLTEDTLRREAAALRQQFRRLKQELRAML